jgi:TonB family protein
MNAVLLYQPIPRWRILIAAVAAVAIHFAAIAVAGIYPSTQTYVAPGTPEIIGQLVFEPPSPEQELTPPDTIDMPPTNPTELQSPPPRHETKKSTPPIKRIGHPGSIGMSSARVLAVRAPRPEYPYEARRGKITGNGVAVMTVDAASGNVIDVAMSKSTGSLLLDNAAITGLRRCRFKAGTVSKVECPITFTLVGTLY